jgi:mono/diheme cytochrome c family protein
MYALKNTLVVLLTTAISAAAFGQEIGDAEKGKRYAEDVCAKCHAVHAGDLKSPLPKAPRFEDAANKPEMTAIALTAWLQSSHPTMPNIVIGDEEMRNVIQYILSLKHESM